MEDEAPIEGSVTTADQVEDLNEEPSLDEAELPDANPETAHPDDAGIDVSDEVPVYEGSSEVSANQDWGGVFDEPVSGLPENDTSLPENDDDLGAEESEDVPEAEDDLEAQSASKPTVSYATHVQNVGWQPDVKDGKTAGTSGRSLRFESFHVKLALPSGLGGGIEYRAQVQNKGWLSWVRDGANCGTTGSSLRMEAVQIRLYGQVAEEYDVYYRVHLQNHGWMTWAQNGGLAGSTGKSLRLEALQVVLVPKGTLPPAESPASQATVAFIDGTALSVSAHVQNVGWQRAVGSGKVAGTTGRSLRVEALRVSLVGSRVPGGITGQAHVQNVGWQGWVANGGTAGTSGRSLRVEAVRYKLTGEAADVWDLYYRVHVQNAGWLAWAKNGESAGSESCSLRIEAIEFRLISKGGAAPSNNGALALSFLTPIGVSYAANVDSAGWGKTVTNGVTAGTTGKSKTIVGLRAQIPPTGNGLTGSLSYDLDFEGGDWVGWQQDGAEALVEKNPEAIRMKLSGDLADVYSVWYRVHLSNAGWLGWARDGQAAGTTDTGMHIEAYQVDIRPKAAGAPGSTASHFRKHGPLSGDAWLDNYVWNMIDSRGWSGYDGLKKSYEFVRNHNYISLSHWPGGNTNSWSRPFAKEFIQRNGGNCHRFAALQYWFAKALGFDARLMTGQWHGVYGSGDHSWVEITYEGKIYIVDAEQGCPSAYPEINWFMIRYKDARLRYYDLSDRRILR